MKRAVCLIVFFALAFAAAFGFAAKTFASAGETASSGAVHESLETGTDIAEHEVEHESGGLPQMDATTFPSQLFWLAVNFAVLFFLMWRVALPPVAETLARRETALQASLAQASKAREQAEYLRNHSAGMTSSAGDEVKALMDKLNIELQAQQQQRHKELTGRIHQQQAEALARIETMVLDAEKALPAEAAKLAQAVVEQLTPLRPSQDQVQKAANSVPADLGAIEWKGAA